MEVLRVPGTPIGDDTYKGNSHSTLFPGFQGLPDPKKKSNGIVFKVTTVLEIVYKYRPRLKERNVRELCFLDYNFKS